MSEQEEIKKRLGKGLLFTDEHIQTLLSSLKKEKERADREALSVNELVLANQDLTEKVRLIQEHANKLGGVITSQTEKRLELEKKVGELDSRIVELVLLIDGYAERIIKTEEKADEKVASLETALDITSGALEGSQDVVREFEKRVKELSDETLNRHDEVMMWVKKCNQAELRLINLIEAVENVFKCGHNNDCLMCAMKDTIALKVLEKVKK